MPKPIFGEGSKEIEYKYYENQNKNTCTACGLKFCTCNKNIFQLSLPKCTKERKKK